MKMLNYKCTECNHETEPMFNDSEWNAIKGTDKEYESIECEVCGAEAKRNNFKNNGQRWTFLD